jgi:dTDP-4-dehydrorhamnose reductase
MGQRSKKIIDRIHPDEFVHESAIKIKRVMIVGASGYLGSALSLGLRDEYEVFGSYHQSPMRIEGAHFFEMNCLNATDILNATTRYNPDIVLYCAGISDIARCTANPMLSDAINTKAMTLFFKVLSRPVPLLYFSCDQVLSVPKPNDLSLRLDELVETNPVNEWGASRARGETQVLGHNRLTYVLRLPRLYGERLGSPYAPRETWVQDIVRKLESKDRVACVTNQWRSSLYIGDAVRALRLFLAKLPLTSTIFNLSPSDSLTPYESALQLAEIFSLDEKLLEAVTLEKYLASKTYEEPHFCSLSGKAFESTFPIRFQSLREGLTEMKERLDSGYTQTWI